MTLRPPGRWLCAFFLGLMLPVAAVAQTPTTAAPAAPAPAAQVLSAEQLDALVAPIALYPDTLLASVLMASTYPLEIVQADRWVSENKKLSADQLKAAVDKQGWDASVKALVATPSVLQMMSSKLDWTQKLGDAVLAQQPDVMDAIQRLRQRAQDNKKLTTTPQQKVVVQQVDNRPVIAIEQTNPNTVYVPYYDPAVAYGDWPYPAYPPYYFGYPGYIGAGIIARGLAFGAGYALGRWVSGGYVWGGGVNWGNRNILVNRPIKGNINVGNNWQHNPVHRQGVRYSNANVQQRFGNNNLRSGAQARVDFRGRSGQQVLRPGGAGAVQRPTTPRATARPTTPRADTRQAKRTNARPAARSSARPATRSNAFGNMQPGRQVHAQSARGQASVRSAQSFSRASVGAGGPRGGGGGFRGGGGGRRSDIALKHDIVLLGHLANGLGFYRFSYIGSDRAYVGVMAQEVEAVMPQAVARDRDGYLRVFYDKLGVTFETYRQWVASGAHVPAGVPIR